MPPTTGAFIRATPRDRAIFYRQMATMIQAGMPLLQALESAEGVLPDRRIRRAVRGVQKEIQQGSGLAESVERYPGVFPPLDQTLIRVGEEGGRLDQVFVMLAGYSEDRLRLRRTVVSALFYPAFLLVAAAFLLPAPIYVLSGFRAYAQFNLLPLTILAAGVGVLVLARRSASLSRRLEEVLSSIPFHLPLVGGIVRRLALSRFCRCLAMGLETGLDLGSTMRIAAPATGLASMEKGLWQAWSTCDRRGTSLVSELADSGLFFPMVIQLLRSGEETGRMDEMALRSAQYLEEEATTHIDRLSSLARPAILLLVGGVLAFAIIRGWVRHFDAIREYIPGAG